MIKRAIKYVVLKNTEFVKITKLFALLLLTTI